MRKKWPSSKWREYKAHNGGKIRRETDPPPEGREVEGRKRRVKRIGKRSTWGKTEKRRGKMEAARGLTHREHNKVPGRVL
ncbi:hypothetical protein SLA2020_274520 [Shorea laevis]